MKATIIVEDGQRTTSLSKDMDGDLYEWVDFLVDATRVSGFSWVEKVYVVDDTGKVTGADF